MKRHMAKLTGLGLAAILLSNTTAMAWERRVEERPLVQVAILLDTSGSMSGMINQAKAQLWSIVNEFATAERNGKNPILQVGLYQYGSPSLGKENGYIKELLPLTDDLDAVSEQLFQLKTSGGDEYCGWVIRTATDQLPWSTNNKDYKAIFIAGNESFSQGSVSYKTACKAAITKGIIVNTIHCAGGADDGWADGARLADGRFMRIDGNKVVAEVEAPQDAQIAELNTQLNKTYIAYGKRGKEARARQMKMDTASSGISGANMAERALSKSGKMYRNTSWDLVDAVSEEEVDLSKVKKADLPEEMKDMTGEERKAYVTEKTAKRAAIQEEIKKLSAQRATYVAKVQLEKVDKNEDTLGNQMKTAVREQAIEKGFTF